MTASRTPALEASDGPASTPDSGLFYVSPSGGGGTSGIYELDDDGTVAGGFGYLALSPNVDNQSFDRTLTASDGANIYFGVNSDPFGAGKITVGTDIIAIGFVITANTGATTSLNSAGTLGGFGVLWSGGAGNYQVQHSVTSGSNKNHRATPAASFTPSIGTTQTYQNLAFGKDYEVILYFNGSTGRVGFCYESGLTSSWVDAGYDTGGTFVDGISPFVFVDNDAAAIGALDGSVQSGSLKTDATWLARASSVLPAGCKTFDGTTI